MQFKKSGQCSVEQAGYACSEKMPSRCSQSKDPAETLLAFSSHSSLTHLCLFVSVATRYPLFPNYCHVSGLLELPGALTKAGGPVHEW